MIAGGQYVPKTIGRVEARLQPSFERTLRRLQRALEADRRRIHWRAGGGEVERGTVSADRLKAKADEEDRRCDF
jgi:hypothetical protein